MSLKSSVTFSTSSNILLTDVWHYQDIPLRYSILREPSSECQVLLSRLSRVLTRGLYSHPVFRSGIHLTQSRLRHILLIILAHLLVLAFSVEFLSHPYWWPTTVPTNQVLLVELNQKLNYWFIEIIQPVVDVVLSTILLINWSLIVAINHPVDTKNICLMLLNNAFWLQNNSITPWY